MKLDPLSPSRKVREGLADQILLFNFETVATPWLQYQYIRLILVQLGYRVNKL